MCLFTEYVANAVFHESWYFVLIWSYDVFDYEWCFDKIVLILVLKNVSSSFCFVLFSFFFSMKWSKHCSQLLIEVAPTAPFKYYTCLIWQFPSLLQGIHFNVLKSNNQFNRKYTWMDFDHVLLLFSLKPISVFVFDILTCGGPISNFSVALLHFENSSSWFTIKVSSSLPQTKPSPPTASCRSLHDPYN